MRAALRYIDELQSLHRDVLPAGPHGWRGSEVTCTDKYGREVRFSAAADAPHHLSALLGVFAEEFAGARDRLDLSACLARLYYGLIAIHPFADGNRRTAFAFLDRRAAEKSFALEGIELLQKCLLEGDVPGDMQRLAALFEHMLRERAAAA
jgi:fido (protein-threonine AMPylation protein)